MGEPSSVENPNFEIDTEVIKGYFLDRGKDLNTFSGLQIELVDRSVEYLELDITTGSHQSFLTGVSNRYLDGQDSTINIKRLLKVVDARYWTIFSDLYANSDPDFRVAFEERTTGKDLRMYRVSVDKTNIPLSAVSIIHDEEYPYFHIQFLIVADTDTPEPTVYEMIN